jgi:hypothetical protein
VGHGDAGFDGSDRFFEVFGEAPALIKLREDMLDDPSVGQDLGALLPGRNA